MSPLDYACLWLGRSTVAMCVAVGLIVAVRLLARYVADCVQRRRDYWQRRDDVARVDSLAEQFTVSETDWDSELARLTDGAQ